MSGKVLAIGISVILVLTLGGMIISVTPLRDTMCMRAGPAVAVAPVPAGQPAPALAPAATRAPAQAAAPAQAVAPAGVTEITVTATDLKLTPANLSVPVGQRVRLTFVNKGALEHDWDIHGVTVTDLKVLSTAPGLSKTLAAQMKTLNEQGSPYAAAGPGQQTVLEFTPTKAGTFEMACIVPGHKEAGMVGTFVVGDGKAVASDTKRPATEAQTAAQVVIPPVKAERRLPLPQMAPPLGRTAPAAVTIDLETREVTALMADGVSTTFWTFNGTVPGPMLRVMEGDTVTINFSNNADSAVTHSIDLHAVTGPGGGARATQTIPGGKTSFTFAAINPGVYVYHCATPTVAQHIANGMYGLIVVEPKGGLPKVDREFYVMQGDFYLQGARGQSGHRPFDLPKMLDERPDYVVFNGSVGALTGEQALRAKVGETVRIYFGVGGPNITSSFHVIGEIFDRVYPEGASQVQTNIQTTLVPAGGATIVDFKLEVPGTYVLVDHSLGRLEKGGAGQLVVEGAENPSVFRVQQAGAGAGGH